MVSDTIRQNPPQMARRGSPREDKQSPAKQEISAGIIVYRRAVARPFNTVPPAQSPQLRSGQAGTGQGRHGPLRDEGPEFLVLYHGHSYWNFPKGKIESEEKSFAAALRETEEETGIMARDLKIQGGFRAHERFTFRREGQQVHKTVVFYLAEARKGSAVTISDEHRGYGWLPVGEARRVLGKYRDSQRVLKQAYDFLMHGQKNAQGQSHTAVRSETSGGVQRKSVRPHAPHLAWQGGNIRRGRRGPWRPPRRPRSGERA